MLTILMLIALPLLATVKIILNEIELKNYIYTYMYILYIYIQLARSSKFLKIVFSSDARISTFGGNKNNYESSKDMREKLSHNLFFVLLVAIFIKFQNAGREKTILLLGKYATHILAKVHKDICKSMLIKHCLHKTKTQNKE